MKLLKLFILIVLLSLPACSNKTIGQSELKNISALPEEELFEKAQDAYEDHLYKVAMRYWNEFLESYPLSVYARYVELKIADTNFATSEFNIAASNYQEYAKNYPNSEAAAYALFQVGFCRIKSYTDQTRDQTPLDSAIEDFNKLLEEYPNSPYSTQARIFIARSNELLADYEAQVILFYIKTDAYKPAVGRYKYLLKTYPNSETAKNIDAAIQTEFPDKYKEFKQTLLGSKRA
jgi:outer membrane protein assembly factor BamD